MSQTITSSIKDSDDYSHITEESSHNGGNNVYYCGLCYHILKITNYGMEIDEIRRVLNYNCPECNNPVLENLNYREGYSPINLENSLNTDSLLKNSQVSQQETLFQPATVFRGLTSSIREIDLNIGGLKQGWFSIFYGSSYANKLAERYCFRAQFPIYKGGLGSTAFLIDAGNSFDPYFIALLARQYFRDPEKSLEKVIISRAFTCYELADLTSNLSEFIETYGSKLVVISDVLNLFNEDITRVEADKIVKHVKQRIMDLCRSRKIVCISTCIHRKKFLEPLIFPEADVQVEFKEHTQILNASLTHHPTNPATNFLIRQASRAVTLDSFSQECETVG